MDSRRSEHRHNEINFNDSSTNESHKKELCGTKCQFETSNEHITEYAKSIGVDVEVAVVDLEKNDEANFYSDMITKETQLEQRLIKEEEQERITVLEQYMEQQNVSQTKDASFVESSIEFPRDKHTHKDISVDAGVKIYNNNREEFSTKKTEGSTIHVTIEEYVEDFLKHNENYVMDEGETEVKESRDAWIVGYVVVNIDERKGPHAVHIKFTEINSKCFVFVFCATVKRIIHCDRKFMILWYPSRLTI